MCILAQSWRSWEGSPGQSLHWASMRWRKIALEIQALLSAHSVFLRKQLSMGLSDSGPGGRLTWSPDCWYPDWSHPGSEGGLGLTTHCCQWHGHCWPGSGSSPRSSQDPCGRLQLSEKPFPALLPCARENPRVFGAEVGQCVSPGTGWGWNSSSRPWHMFRSVGSFQNRLAAWPAPAGLHQSLQGGLLEAGTCKSHPGDSGSSL